MSKQPPKWTSCQHNPSHILNHETQSAGNAISDPAVCWVCGDVFDRGDECHGRDRVFWHRGRPMRSRRGDAADSGMGKYHDHGDGNHGVAAVDNWLDLGTSASRCEEGQEMNEAPSCVPRPSADGNDDNPAQLRKRVDVANGRPGRNGTSMGLDQTQLGGDSSMDIQSSSPLPPLDEDGEEASGTGSIGPGETIARLHIRRSRQDPRFAELEGVIPLDSGVQISMDIDHASPAHTHTLLHTARRPPHPSAIVRRPLPWLSSWNQKGEEEEERPASVLDAHFLPCSTTQPSRGGGIAVDKRDADIRLGVNLHLHEVPDPAYQDSHAKRITAGPRCDTEPLDIERTASAESQSSPPLIERAFAEAQKVLNIMSSGLTGGEEDEHSTCDMDANSAKENTRENNHEPEPDNNTAIPIHEKTSEKKGKNVAWDPTVARGESESGSDCDHNPNPNHDPAPDPDPDPDLHSESSHESYERELADYYIPTKPAPGDPRKRRALITSPPPPSRQTPAQSKEFVDLYRPGKTRGRDEARLASLAMPGRGRDRGIARGRGRFCSQCGRWE